MSYRTFKRLLGETGLEFKCRMLFATGLLIGARAQMSWSRRIFVGCVNASFGLVIVGLKVWVH